MFIQKELYDRISSMSVYSTMSTYETDANSIRTITAQIDSLECAFVEENYDNVLGVSWFLRMCDEASSNAGYYCMPPKLQTIYNTAPPSFKMNREIQHFREMCKGALYNQGYYNY